MLALLLDAEIDVAGPGGSRTIAARDFFGGLFTTALEPDEVVTEVRFPAPSPNASIQEFARRQGDFAVVAASAALELDDGRVRSARIALSGVGDAPVRATQAETLLAGADVGRDAFVEAGRVAAEPLTPPSDIHGSSRYRKELAAALVRRALVEAADLDG
jgi:carbon-monoxide dehydrogenase medium subunit